FFLFFFSSRRRHTRSDRDWSSDVCSSDLAVLSHPFRELDKWMRQYRGLWEARLDRFGAELNRRQKARAGKRRETHSWQTTGRRRSEERRVGKERRSEWTREQENKKHEER